ncbi:MAG: glycosyltransferase [Anaerolineae bacterium]
MKAMMYTAWGAPCGIRDYSADLMRFLNQQITCEVVPVPEPLPSIWRSRWVFAHLGRKMNDGDVAHLQHSFAFWGGASQLRNRFEVFRSQIRVPVVMTVHDIYDQWEVAQPPATRSIRRRVYALVRRWLYRLMTDEATYLRHLNINTFQSVARLIVHSESHRQVLLQRGVSPERITVIPLGVPTYRVIAANAAVARQRWNLDGKRVLTMFGFIVPEKGYDLAVESLNQLPSDCVLLIAGGPREVAGEAYLAELRRLIAERNLTARVIVTGYVPEPDLPAIMAATDIVLAPFKGMSGSASLALSLAYGKPIVASDLEPNREINVLVPCLALFETGRVEHLTLAIQQLLADEARRCQLADRALEYARQFACEQTARLTIDVYRQVLATESNGN